ncbi:MAG: hypothetical protein WDM71_04955 [Ferruginibacter sp.]
MDTKYHIDIFERLLKERSDEFRIYPSNRVWQGIYNSIYPGRKLPSAATSLLLLAIFFLTGFLNSNISLQSSSSNNSISNSKVPVAENLYNTYFFSPIINDPITAGHNVVDKNSGIAIITAIPDTINAKNEIEDNSKSTVFFSVKNKHLLVNYFSLSAVNLSINENDIHEMNVSKKLVTQNNLSVYNEILANAYH